MERLRFTAEQRRRRRWVISASAIVLGLFVAVFGVAYSPLMAVRTIEVRGLSTLDPETVTGALSSQLGTPLPLVSTRAIADTLSSFPAVASFRTESVPPSTLIVHVVERTPVGFLETPNGFETVDAAGVVLATTPERPAGLPPLDVEGDTSSPTFAALGRVLLALPPDMRASLVSASADSPSSVRFELGGGPEVVWGTASDSPLKLRTLLALMTATGGQVSEIDVSAPTSPVTR